MTPRISFADLTGADGALQSVCERAALAAKSDVPVFLLGEPGAGKETLARAIANESGAPGRFIPLRASRMTEDRWNELVSGPEAFAGGVVYIAEAERIPRVPGRRLATALQLGKVGFRAIFGSAVPFSQLRSSRTLAPELLELFAAFPIAVPALRERPEDFAALAERFFLDASERLGVWRDPLSDSELDRLRDAQWPENLDSLRRALDAIVERDVFPESAEELTEFAGADASTTAPERAQSREAPASDEPETESKRFQTLDEAAKEHIERALKLSRGVIEGKNGAASLLDINPYTLRARMRKLGVDWASFRDDDLSD